MNPSEVVAWIAGGVSVANLVVLARFTFLAGRWVGKIETTLKGLEKVPNQIHALNRTVALMLGSGPDDD